MNQFGSWSRAFTVVLLLAATVGLALFPLSDYDLFWHLANGRWMVEHGRIVEEEVFSFSAPGAPFANHWWLSQWLLFQIFHLFGADGLLTLKAVEVSLLGVMILLSSRVLGGNTLLTAMLWLWGCWAILVRLEVRPEMFTFMWLTVTALLLHGFATGRFTPKVLRALPVIIALWDMTHAALVALPLLYGFALICEALPWLHRRFPNWDGATPLPQERQRALRIWMGTTCAVQLINPWGLTSYGDFFLAFTGLYVSPNIGEYLPTPWQGYWPFWSFLVLVVGGLLAQGRRLQPFHGWLVLVYGVMAIRYSRGVAFFVLVTTPLLAAWLTAWLESWRIRGRVVLLVVLGVVLLPGAWLVKQGLADGAYGWGFGINEEFLPVGAVRFIQEHGLKGPYYNNDRYGGYLAYYLAPTNPIFYYNHPILFGEVTRARHSRAEMARWNFNFALVGEELELRYFFTPDRFTPVYWEPAAMVVLQNTPENEPFIRKHGLRYFQPDMTVARALELGRNPIIGRRLAEEVVDHLSHRRNDGQMAVLKALWPKLDAQTQASLSLVRVERYNGPWL